MNTKNFKTTKTQTSDSVMPSKVRDMIGEVRNKLGDNPFPENTYPKYGIEARTLTLNGKETGRQMITYKNEFMNVASTRYHVTPNEELFETAKQVCKKLGLEAELPNHRNYHRNGNQSWYKIADFGDCLISSGNAQKNKGAGGQMIATFLSKNEVDVTGTGDNVRTGVSVIGSIDGTSSTKIVATDDRSFCANRFLHLGNAIVSSEAINETATNIKKVSEEDGWKFSGKWYHTRKVENYELEDVIKIAGKRAEDIIQKYQDLKNLKVTKSLCDGIISKLGKNLAKELDYIDIDKKSNIVSIDENTNQWSALNQITEKMWHGNFTKNMGRVVQKYREVDEIFQLVV